MNKPHWTLAQFLKELVSAEGLIKKPSTGLVIERGSSSKPKGNKKKKKVQKQVHVLLAALRPQGGVKKPKGKCFHYKQSRHWKKQCPAYLNKLNKQGKSYSLVVETCLAMLSTDTWCVETRATNHVRNSLRGFQETRQLSNREIYLHMGTGTKVAAVAIGDYYLNFGRDRYLLLKDCLYVPSIRRNLISFSSLVKDGYSVLFSDSVIIKLNKRFIYSSTLVDNLYIINPVCPSLQQNELNNTNVLPCKRKEPSQMNQTYLWHLRLGHINLK